MQRKMAAGRESTPTGARSALRALRLAMARSAADVFDLPLSVIGATQNRCGQDRLGQHLGDDQLLMLLDGPDGLVGAASLDKDCIAVLIQQQTMGLVTGVSPSERAFTGTDAALAAPLIDATLKRAVDLVDLPADQRCLHGFQFGARADDLRSLMLALDADKYRIFALTLDFASGKQQGEMLLVLPEVPEPVIEREENPTEPAGPRMDQTIGTVRADLTAVICRLQIPLAELATMAPGDVLPLVREQLSQTDLISINGSRVASGRLGQIGGLRAIRVNETQPEAPSALAGGELEFAVRIAPPLPDPDEMVTIEETALPDSETATSTPEPPGLVKSDDEVAFGAMTPEQAAAEISELAGLSLDGESGAQAEEVI